MKELIFSLIGAGGNVDGVNYAAGIIAAILILIYLIYTLVKPEKF